MLGSCSAGRNPWSLKANSKWISSVFLWQRKSTASTNQPSKHRNNPHIHRLNNCIYLNSNVIELKIFAKPSIFHPFRTLDYRLQSPYIMEEKGVLKTPWKRYEQRLYFIKNNAKREKMNTFKSCYFWRSSEFFFPMTKSMIHLTLQEKVIFKIAAHIKSIVSLNNLFYKHSCHGKENLLFFSIAHKYSVIFIFGSTSSLFIPVISLQYDFVADLTKDFIAVIQLNQDSTLVAARNQTKLM